MFGIKKPKKILGLYLHFKIFNKLNNGFEQHRGNKTDQSLTNVKTIVVTKSSTPILTIDEKKVPSIMADLV